MGRPRLTEVERRGLALWRFAHDNATKNRRRATQADLEAVVLRLVIDARVDELRASADAIDALHPDEAPKNSAIFLRERATRLARATVKELVERSSLGTELARTLRASVSDEEAARVVARAMELDS